MTDIIPHIGPEATRVTPNSASPLDKFSAMDDTVNEMCRLLKEDPLNWVFDTNTFHYSKSPNVEYWNGRGFTCIWNGHTTHKVFSDEQGHKIEAAINIARLHQSSVMQQRVMRAMGTAAVSQQSTSIFSWLKSIFRM